MRDKGYDDINFVTHSLGSYVAYKAIAQENFPADKLRNVISLASPNHEAPQFLTADLTSTLKAIKKDQKTVLEHVAYFDFDGGVRDFFVGQSLAQNKVETPEN